MQIIAAPAGGVFRFPVWLPASNQILVQYEPAGVQNSWDISLATVELDGSAAPNVIALPSEPRCRSTGHMFPTALPDGRVGYVQTCYGITDFSKTTSVMAWDPTSGAASRLVPYYVQPLFSFFSYPPDMQRGIGSDGVGLRERLEWLGPDRLQPLDLPFARAGPPVWSPDGTAIAVDAAPTSAASGVERATLARKMYLLSRDGGQPRELFGGFIEAYRPSWSRDGRQFVVALDPGDQHTGLWLVDATSGKRTLIFSADQIEATAWLPDGRILVSVGTNDQFKKSADKPGIYVFKLANETR